MARVAALKRHLYINAQTHTSNNRCIWSAAPVATVQFSDIEHRWKMRPSHGQKRKTGERKRAGGKVWDHVKREVHCLWLIKHSCFKSAQRQHFFIDLVLCLTPSSHPFASFFPAFILIPCAKVAIIHTRADSLSAAITTLALSHMWTFPLTFTQPLMKVCMSLPLCELWVVARGACGVN